MGPVKPWPDRFFSATILLATSMDMAIQVYRQVAGSPIAKLAKLKSSLHLIYNLVSIITARFDVAVVYIMQHPTMPTNISSGLSTWISCMHKM